MANFFGTNQVKRNGDIVLPSKTFSTFVRIIIVAFVCISAVFGLSSPKIAHAGSGTINVFHVYPELTFVISVSCPGDVGFDWRVGDEFGFFNEGTTKTGNGYFPANRYTPNALTSHNAIAQLHCSNENWDNATTSTIGFTYDGRQAQNGGVTVTQVPNQNPPSSNGGGNSGGNSGGNGGGSSNNSSGANSVSNARQNGTPGGVDLIYVCHAWGYSTASNSNGAWNGWYCDSAPVDWSRVCLAVWGTSNYTHGSDKYSIRCGGDSNSSSTSSGGNTGSSSGSSGFTPEQSSGCDLSGSSQVSRGDHVVVTYQGGTQGGLHLRSLPSLSAHIIANLYEGDTAWIASTSTCADGYRWWPVDTAKGSGWIAESGSDGQYISTTSSGQSQPAQDPSDCSFSSDPSTCEYLKNNLDLGQSPQYPMPGVDMALAFPTSVHVCEPDCGGKDSNYVEFHLPRNGYDGSSVDLHFAYLSPADALSWGNGKWQCPDDNANSSQECIRIGLSHRLVSIMVNAHIVDVSTLRNTSNWYVTYRPN